ncbi:hypothetical protein H5410_023433 [Solanum commersonii]|uniref:Uncharacterized protein n=1 Tax=Solanum commersonii TaxID=4109 RepID=A0A9J5ZJA8_SOLCO|nr:hypothetical protein H5410_023433 [Solanum commersonii]
MPDVAINPEEVPSEDLPVKSQRVVGFEQFIIADFLKIESVDVVLTISRATITMTLPSLGFANLKSISVPPRSAIDTGTCSTDSPGTLPARRPCLITADPSPGKSSTDEIKEAPDIIADLLFNEPADISLSRFIRASSLEQAAALILEHPFSGTPRGTTW